MGARRRGPLSPLEPISGWNTTDRGEEGAARASRVGRRRASAHAPARGGPDSCPSE